MSVSSSIGSLIKTQSHYPSKLTPSNSAISTAAPDINQSLKTIEIDNPAYGIGKIIDQVEKDPKFAKEMVEIYTFIPDREIYDANDVPSDFEEWKAFQERTNQFSQIAEAVTEKRAEIYNKMKTGNASDSDIFKALMEFNKSLPMDYQLKTGLAKYNFYT